MYVLKILRFAQNDNVDALRMILWAPQNDIVGASE